MAEQQYWIYQFDDVPMTGCRTICRHVNRGLTSPGTLFCSDCQCEWEWGVPQAAPHFEPGWCYTQRTLRMLARILPEFKKRSFLDWLCNPDGF